MKRIVDDSTIRAVAQYMLELSVPKVPIAEVMQIVQRLETAPKLEQPQPTDTGGAVSVDDVD